MPTSGVHTARVRWDGTLFRGWLDFGSPGTGENAGMFEFHFDGFEGTADEVAWIFPSELEGDIEPKVEMGAPHGKIDQPIAVEFVADEEEEAAEETVMGSTVTKQKRRPVVSEMIPMEKRSMSYL